MGEGYHSRENILIGCPHVVEGTIQVFDLSQVNLWSDQRNEVERGNRKTWGLSREASGNRWNGVLHQ
jgi:hypothetical protein